MSAPLRRFLGATPARAGSALAQLRRLRFAVEACSTVRILGASVLLVFDADAEACDGGVVRVSLIDFAHAFSGAQAGGADENLASGMRGLERALEELSSLQIPPD